MCLKKKSIPPDFDTFYRSVDICTRKSSNHLAFCREQPFVFLPSFREQTPLHLQNEASTGAEDIFQRKTIEYMRYTKIL